MDPFEVRMQFLTLLRRLNASQQSIQKVVAYALKYFSRCGEDLWDCVVEECQKGSINTRINILYLLDSLCETSLLAKANLAADPAHAHTNHGSFYVDYVTRDLGKIVEYVVPDGREGLPNLMSATQILDNWRSKRIIDPQQVDEITARLHSRKASLQLPNPSSHPPSSTPPRALSPSPSVDTHSSAFSRSEIFKRIEEDRERHKRLRERRWVQPISHVPASHLPQLASFMPPVHYRSSAGDSGGGGEGGDKDDAGELTIDIEFDNEWETTSDWNEDDDEAAAEENMLCFPSNVPLRGDAMDVSPHVIFH